MKKDGHTDVASSRRMVQAICEDAQDILKALPQDAEAELPTWWTNKLAVCSAYLNSARDYLLYSDDIEVETSEEDDDEPFTLTISDDDLSKEMSEEDLIELVVELDEDAPTNR